ncbi:hypothetical protein FOL47_000557 [Perkinsus chesapeaki]|uniref:Uncharacterized protein n=1 Tax=Perkinsus chesapeaki TaxID=330153 RepID=A0A7J6N137_PERCH|nr:hypothetical protein FOL47_000557 [Perkinsus chesapeaki]
MLQSAEEPHALSWEDAKLRSREMVRCVESGLNELSRSLTTLSTAAAAAAEEGQEAYPNSKTQVIANLEASTSDNLDDLGSAVKDMTSFAKSAAQRAQVQRDQGILLDLRRQYDRLCNRIDTETKRAKLMGQAEGTEKESAGENDDERNLLRERNGIESSIRELDDMYSSAAATHRKMRQQNSVLSKVKGKLGIIDTSHMPGINGLVKRIGNQKMKNKLILGAVVGACICFTIWDQGDRRVAMPASPMTFHRTIKSTSHMNGCIVTQELREIQYTPLYKARRLCFLEESSPELSGDPSSPEPSVDSPITPFLLTRSPDIADQSTSSSSRSHCYPPLAIKGRYNPGYLSDVTTNPFKLDPSGLHCDSDLSTSSRLPESTAVSPAMPIPDNESTLLPPEVSKKRKRPSPDQTASTQDEPEDLPIIPGRDACTGASSMMPTTNGYRLLQRPPPLDLTNQAVLLLGMVYASEARRQCEGQGKRDTMRITALENQFKCQVYTIDKTHPERVAYVKDGETHHIQTNFNDSRRMLSSFQSAWGKNGHKKFHLIALDYFRSPAGWSETNWCKAFFDHTLPALSMEGWMTHDARIILPNTTCTMRGILASDELQACFHIALLQDPNDNPLWASTGALESDGTLHSMSGHYTNETERRHLHELAPFIQLTPLPTMYASRIASDGG